MDEEQKLFNIENLKIKRDAFFAEKMEFYQNKAESSRELFIPFEISEDKFKEIVICELSKGELTPDDILLKSKFRYFSVLLPFYLIKGYFTGILKYTAIDYKNKTRYCFENQYIDGKYQKVQVEKPERVEYGHPEENRIENKTYNDLIIATDFKILLDTCSDSSKLKSFLEELYFVESDLKSFEERFLGKVNKIPFSYNRIEAEEEAENRMTKMINNKIYKNLIGVRQTDYLLKTYNNINDIKKIYLPFWFVIYSYNNINYYFSINGHNSKKYNKPPIDTNKVKKLTLTFLKYYLVPILLIILTISAVNFFIKKPFIEISLKNIILLSLLIMIPTYFKIRDLINESKHTRKEIYQKVKSGSIKIDLISTEI